MSDAQEIVEMPTKRAGVAQLLSLRSPSDYTLSIIIILFVLMLILQAFQNAIGELIIIFTMLIISTALLILSADFFVVGAKCIARKFGIAEVIIGLTIVSIGTSLPEIMVTGTAAMKANSSSASIAELDTLSDLAIGNIYGSVLVQISLILGIVVLYKPLEVRPSWLGRDGLLMVLSLLLFTLLLLTGSGLSRIEGAFLSCFYILYLVYLVKNRNKIRAEEGELVENIRGGFAWSTAAATIMVIVGLAMAIYASEHLIESVLKLGVSLNLDQGAMGAIMGTSVSAVGTSLPELTVALLCVRKSQGVAIGALIGSNITDPLLSVGIAAMIHPLSISSGAYFVTTAIIMPMTILGIITCTILMWTDFKFNRTEGLMMILYYLIFLAALILDQLGKLPF
ncbi:MAG TPA: sodium:calcium antiporter [Candidatus Poseidoniaceae archaeon]|nr:sodium:calcium antiporter [Candidatus Poseidoniaceae archaeon]